LKKLFLYTHFFVLTICALAQNGYKIQLLGKWNNPNLPKSSIGQIWNDLTGYYDSTSQREYIIAGATDSIYFFDVTNPAKIKLCAVAFGNNRNMINRDFECYSNYVYCVSDNGAFGSLQVFNLKYLPDTVTKVYDSDSIAANTHSIFINQKSKRLYLCGNRFKTGGRSGIDVVSLQNPEKPIKIGRLKIPVTADGAEFFRTVHEIYQRNDTIYASAEYYGLWIFDLNDLGNQKLLGIIKDYPFNGYNHNSWVSPNGKYIVFTDEVPQGLPLKIFKLDDFNNAKLVTTFGNANSGKSTPHNPYWIGDFIYVSYYHDGFYIFNAKDPENVYTEGWFNTSPVPPTSYEGFAGNWGLYPFLPSGNIALLDMQYGLFMVKPDKEITSDNEIAINNMAVFPNPTTNFVTLNNHVKAAYSILNVNGKTLANGIIDINGKIFFNNFNPGIYILNIITPAITYTCKIVKY